MKNQKNCKKQISRSIVQWFKCIEIFHPKEGDIIVFHAIPDFVPTDEEVERIRTQIMFRCNVKHLHVVVITER